MFNKSTNINKTNNHLSPQIIEQLKTTTYDVGNAGRGLGQARNLAGLNRSKGSQPLWCTVVRNLCNAKIVFKSNASTFL